MISSKQNIPKPKCICTLNLRGFNCEVYCFTDYCQNILFYRFNFLTHSTSRCRFRHVFLAKSLKSGISLEILE